MAHVLQIGARGSKCVSVTRWWARYWKARACNHSCLLKFAGVRRIRLALWGAMRTWRMPDAARMRELHCWAWYLSNHRISRSERRPGRVWSSETGRSFPVSGWRLKKENPGRRFLCMSGRRKPWKGIRFVCLEPCRYMMSKSYSNSWMRQPIIRTEKRIIYL